MEKIDHIIHAKWIITCEKTNPVLQNHAILILNGKIHDILPSDQANKLYQGNTSHYYSEHAVMPGFINSHTHAAMNIFRGLADDLELMDWLNNYIWPAEGKWVSHELVYDASLLAIAEMIRGGTICFNDMYFFLDATAKAALDAGIRAHIGMTIIDVPTAWAKTTEEYFEKSLEFYHAYKNNDWITPTLAPHSTYTVSLENLMKVKTLADQYQLKVNLHLQEAPSEMQHALKHYNSRPLKRLHQIGMVNPDLIAIHMTQLDEDDLQLLKETKPNVVHCPESNMKLVSGACPTAKLMASGVNVALGTDGAASNNDLDMFGEMRSAAFLGKVTANDPKAVSASEVLNMATINGAKALGIDHLTGSLKKGKSADFIAVHLEQIETQPLYHVISQIVYAASRYQVTDVWVGGKQLLKDRKLLTLDEKELLKKAENWRKKIGDGL
ncbi:MAG: N-ethylammeline chlorohydrolase [Gammaproteobacteria bacterium RIFCSPHIGHO2_12_FULL_38_14]|nr:MAG: N-ethylammeline chlorohydrolase [Gammaproteobacteria bacterium RIFCSPHIGHO2_12_FULL_38_14]